MRVDLNCDLGESADPDRLAMEERIMASVTSVNVACGVHAGSPDVMRRTVLAARLHGVAVGAHPGFPDREGMGRTEGTVPVAEVERLVADQVRALSAVAAEEGVTLAHVKPHGALYHLAARDRSAAEAVARAVAVVDRRLVLFGLAGSPAVEAGLALGLTVAEEAFADRGYRADGSLVPRGQAGALITDEREVAARVLRLVREGTVETVDGAILSLRADTICLHGDTPGADRLARLVRRELIRAGVRLLPVGASDAA
ncbi:MAG: 5-oxoprolinase subunit PxpA [Nitrospirota bacterium]